MVIVVDYVILLVCSVAFGDCSSPMASVFVHMYFENTIAASVSEPLHGISGSGSCPSIIRIPRIVNRSLCKQFRKFTCSMLRDTGIYGGPIGSSTASSIALPLPSDFHFHGLPLPSDFHFHAPCFYAHAQIVFRHMSVGVLSMLCSNAFCPCVAMTR